MPVRWYDLAMATHQDSVRIGVVGLGYVGLPLALAMAEHFPTVGFDLDGERVAALRRGHDTTGEVTDAELAASPSLTYTSTTNLAQLQDATFYIVAVPTPVDAQNRPDLEALRRASEALGEMLRAGDVVVYESTVYPGATEEVCIPILEETSGLSLGEFHVGYSPERINPGDKERPFTSIKKVVGATSEAALGIVAGVYETVVSAGVHRASSVRVAEASKIVENIQRDVNIALVNELAVIFDRLGIPTHEVLAAAATKWNWINVHPGLVGGHCIGVDPYYMAAKAEEVGIAAQVLISGRRINESMGAFVAQRVLREMNLAGIRIKGAEVLILGAAFKVGVGDVRNSKAFDVAEVLEAHGCEVFFYDPLVDRKDAKPWPLLDEGAMRDLKPAAVVLAVPQPGLADVAVAQVNAHGTKVLADLHGAVPRSRVEVERYWRL